MSETRKPHEMRPNFRNLLDGECCKTCEHVRDATVFLICEKENIGVYAYTVCDNWTVKVTEKDCWGYSLSDGAIVKFKDGEIEPEGE